MCGTSAYYYTEVKRFVRFRKESECLFPVVGSQHSSPVRLCKPEKQIYDGRDEGSADNYILSIGCRSEGAAGHLTVSVLPFAEGFSACPIIHTEGTHLDAFKGIRCMFLRACSYKTTADALLSVLFGMESLAYHLQCTLSSCFAFCVQKTIGIEGSSGYAHRVNHHQKLAHDRDFCLLSAHAALAFVGVHGAKKPIMTQEWESRLRSSPPKHNSAFF